MARYGLDSVRLEVSDEVIKSGDPQGDHNWLDTAPSPTLKSRRGILRLYLSKEVMTSEPPLGYHGIYCRAIVNPEGKLTQGEDWDGPPRDRVTYRACDPPRPHPVSHHRSLSPVQLAG